MDSKDRISPKQLSVLAFFCFFSPAVRLLPGLPAEAAGKAAWVSPLFAAVPLLLYIWLLRSFLRCKRDNEGMPELFSRCVGNVLGKALTVLYSAWFAFYAGFALRVSAERLLSSVYEEGGISFFRGTLIIIAVLISLGNVRSLVRTAQTLVPGLIFVVVMMLLFSISDFKVDNILPVTYLDAPDIARGTLPILSVMGLFLYFSFLTAYEDNVKGAGKYMFRFMFLALAMVFLIGITTIGAQSAELVKNIQNPFFIMVHNIKLFGIIDRMEAVVLTLWVSTDILLLASLLMMGSEALRSTVKAKKRTLFVIPIAAVALPVSFLIAQNAFSLKRWSEIYIPIISAVLFFAVIPLIFFIGKLRKKLVPWDKYPQSGAGGDDGGEAEEE